jgi:hypothetical protein
MSVSGVSTPVTHSYNNYAAKKTADTVKANETTETKKEQAVAEEATKNQSVLDTLKTTGKESVSKTKSKMTTEQRAQVQKALDDASNQTARFEKFVSASLGMQGKVFKNAFNDAANKGELKHLFQNVNVTAEERVKAQEMVSEDGFYGAKQTSERLLSFAKAYAGNDLDKIEEMRSAFEKGYGQAEKAWGDELPQVSQDTYDLVQEGFDKMVSGASGVVTGEE